MSADKCSSDFVWFNEIVGESEIISPAQEAPESYVTRLLSLRRPWPTLRRWLASGVEIDVSKRQDLTQW